MTQHTRRARPFGAVGTAMVTPLTEDASGVDLDAAQRLAAHVVEHGNDMIVVSGTTGEAPTLSDGEKIDLARAVREAVGPEVTILAGVGTYDTAHSVHLARAHAELEIDGLLVVTPYYSKPSQAGIIQHTRAIADATVVMERSGLAYYSGEDALNLPWLAIGASGMVSVVSQVAGDLEKRLVDAVDRSDLAAAREAHQLLAPLVEAIMTHMPGAVAAKTALALQGVLPHATMRGPLLAADDDQTRALAAALEAATGIPPLDPSRRPSA